MTRDELALVVGRNLKSLRRKQGFDTAVAFAEHIGVRAVTLCKYEKGRMLPGTEILYRIAESCSVSVDELLGRKPQATTPAA
mgnify:CR=1 FL=1